MSAAPARATPVSTGERIATLDAIRGVALFGIFVMNMPWFGTSFYAGTDTAQLWPQWWDRAADLFVNVMLSGKFNGMFSMLFAVGFTIQLERLLVRDLQHAIGIYLRRLFWLFVFGVLHACVFWTGDILHIYAVLGLVLLLLRKSSDRIILALIVACLLFPVMSGLIQMSGTTAQDMQRLASLFARWESLDNAIYAHGTFLEAARHHARSMVLLYSDPQLLLRSMAGYVQILTTMLIGLLLGRHHFFQNVTARLPSVRRVQWWSLGIGVACGIVFGVWTATVTDLMSPTAFKSIAGLAYVLSRVAITAFYVCLIIRAIHSTRGRSVLAPIALAGRMPLTNYLLQTLFGTFLFYHWGLGLWGRIGPALDVVLAAVIFLLVQVPLSRLWLSYFAAGPLEYLWRRLTYGHDPLQTFRIRPRELPVQP